MQKNKIIRGSIIGITLIVVILGTVVWGTTFHPAEVQAEAIVCDENAPTLSPDQNLKILTYNVRYMAGRNQDLFCDLPNDDPDEWLSMLKLAGLVEVTGQEFIIGMKQNFKRIFVCFKFIRLIANLFEPLFADVFCIILG